MITLAGVWGDNPNIRFLFVDQQSYGYLRNIMKREDSGYDICDFGIDAKGISVRQLSEL